MNFHQLFLILNARRFIVITTALFTIITAVVVSLLLPKGYMATTTLVLNYKGSDPVTGMPLPAQLMPGYMATQVDVISSVTVALRVVDRLKLHLVPEAKEQFMNETEGKGDIRHWLAELLLKKLTVMPARESSVLNLSFTGVDPEFAAEVANAFAKEYQAINIQLKMDPLRNASNYFNSQISVIRANLESAQQKLSQYQQDKGIVSVDNRLDVETGRLNDLSTQLVVIQGQLMEATSRSKQAQGTGAGESPDVVANPLIQNLKSSLVQAETKFSEVALRLANNHPQYQSAEAEVQKLRSELAKHVLLTSNSVGNNARILQRREAELRVSLQAQKEKVLDLNRARDELAVLMREVDSAQKAYDVTTQRFTQTSLEGQSNQADVAILTPAEPPIDPATPRILLNTSLSVFAGMILGLIAGLLSEYLDRRVRSTADVVGLLDVPVLGEVVSKTKKKSKLFRHSVVPPWGKGSVNKERVA